MINITEDILLDAGFEYQENESNILKKHYLEDNYKIFRKWTDDTNPIKLDIDNGPNNRGTTWSLHIDNCDCETIGCADIDTIEQFNMLMKVFDSDLRLSQKENPNDQYTKEIEKFNKLVEHLYIVKSGFIINSKHISAIEKEKLYNELNSLIKSTHLEFITLCKNISDIIYKKYLFERQSQAIFELITNETENAIYNVFNKFSYALNPKILYDLIYGYLQTDDDRNKIKNAKYLGTPDACRNKYWIDKIILKVIGYDI